MIVNYLFEVCTRSTRKNKFYGAFNNCLIEKEKKSSKTKLNYFNKRLYTSISISNKMKLWILENSKWCTYLFINKYEPAISWLLKLIFYYYCFKHITGWPDSIYQIKWIKLSFNGQRESLKRIYFHFIFKIKSGSYQTLL